MSYPIHPALAIVSQMSTAEIDELAADLKANGQLEAITLWKGMLIDGRSRLEAFHRLGWNPRTAELDDDQDPIAYIRSANLFRAGRTKADRKRFDEALRRMQNAQAEGGAE